MQVTQSAANYRAWLIQNDKKLVALKVELARLEEELDAAERLIPENVRDRETIELHLEGETRESLRDIVQQFIESYLQLRDFAMLYRRKKKVEIAIEARKQALLTDN